MVRIKKIRVGAELEFFTVNDSGEMVNRSDALIKKLKMNQNLEKIDVQPEIGKSMVELNFPPAEDMTSVYENVISSLANIYESAESLGLIPLLSGTYPGRATYKMRRKKWYSAKRKVVGKVIENELGVCGFHFHYTLPSGIVGKSTEKINHLKYSASKDAFLNIYNFSIAADPAFITMTQSSPYRDGKYIGKDSRVISYRDFGVDVGGKKIEGMHSGLFSPMGGLPNYEFTLRDVKWSADNRKEFYIQILRRLGYDISSIIFKPSLAFMWGPIRVNKIGTLEYRGMDTTDPRYQFSASVLMEKIIASIIENEYRAIPSDVGVDEPFKLEDGIIYLPPFSYVKSIEKLSTLYGFGNTSVHKYVSSLFRLAKKITDINKSPFFDHIKYMLNDSLSISDKIIKLVMSNSDNYKSPSEDVLKYSVLKYTEDIKKVLK